MSSSNPPLDLADLDRAPETLPLPAGLDPLVYLQRLIADNLQLAEQVIAQREELARLRSLNTTRALLDELIKPFSHNVFVFMCVYAVFVAGLLLLDGLHLWTFRLSPSVLSLLVGSTAVTVIGLVGMVLTGVFVGARR